MSAGAFRFPKARVYMNYKMRNFLGWMRTKFPKILLVSFLALTVIYIFLHPINKIRVKFILTGSCTIEVIESKGDHVSLAGRQEVRIDGKWMTDGEYYYEIDDEKVYRYYYKKYGEWERTLHRDYTDGSTVKALGGEYFKRSNYKRVKGKLFVWEYCGEDDEVLGLENVTVQRSGGIISIVGDSGSTKVAIRFRRFGITRISLPWEE